MAKSHKETALDIIWSCLRQEYIATDNKKKAEIFNLLGLSEAEVLHKKGDRYTLSVKNNNGAFHYIPTDREPFINGSNGIPLVNEDGICILKEERVFNGFNGRVKVIAEIVITEETDEIIVNETFWHHFQKIILKEHEHRKECDVCGSTDYTGFHTILKDSIPNFSLNPSDYIFVCNKCKPETAEERQNGGSIWKA